MGIGLFAAQFREHIGINQIAHNQLTDNSQIDFARGTLVALKHHIVPPIQG